MIYQMLEEGGGYLRGPSLNLVGHLLLSFLSIFLTQEQRGWNLLRIYWSDGVEHKEGNRWKERPMVMKMIRNIDEPTNLFILSTHTLSLSGQRSSLGSAMPP